MHTSGIQSKPHKALLGTGQATANKLVPAILEAGGHTYARHQHAVLSAVKKIKRDAGCYYLQGSQEQPL